MTALTADESADGQPVPPAPGEAVAAVAVVAVVARVEVSEPVKVADAAGGEAGEATDVETGTAAEAEAAAAAAAAALEVIDPERAARLARDRKLVARLKQGDARAFQELVVTYQDRIFGLVYRMIGNRQEAEDIAQEVFLSVHRAIGGYRGEGQIYTWLYRIAVNTCRNRVKYLKARNFHRSDDIDESPQAHMAGHGGGAVKPLQSAVPGPEAQLEGARLEAIVQRELAALDEEHRVLIVLRDVQGMTYQDIVRITGLPEGTLKSRLHRARLALKLRVDPFLR